MKHHKPIFQNLKEWLDEMTRFDKKQSRRLNRRFWNRKIQKELKEEM